jgi:sugar-specific transcriptional regulator TrmB
MHIAIDVNDSSVANKILEFLNGFKKEVTITTSKDDEAFLKNRESLQKIYKNITSSSQTLQSVDDEFWDEMDSVIKNA